MIISLLFVGAEGIVEANLVPQLVVKLTQEHDEIKVDKTVRGHFSFERIDLLEGKLPGFMFAIVK